MVSAGNRRNTTVAVAGSEGYRREPLFQFSMQFSMQRYREAYRRELTAFVDAVASGAPMSPDARDGLAALEIAVAAKRSARKRRSVPVRP